MVQDFTSMLRRAAYGLDEPALIGAILEVVNERPLNWFTIGITDDPGHRRMAHGDPPLWHHWPTASETSARRVENYFRRIQPPMNGGVGGETGGTFLYVFLGKSPT